jgi:hypothetical protein
MSSSLSSLAILSRRYITGRVSSPDTATHPFSATKIRSYSSGSYSSLKCIVAIVVTHPDWVNSYPRSEPIVRGRVFDTVISWFQQLPGVGVPAVDDERLAIDVAREVAREKEGGPRDIVGFADPPRRDRLDELIERL